MSCEMEWLREEESGTIFLTDIRNIVLAKQNNRAFTNSLYRHMKRNMVAILDEEKKEQDEMREAALEQKYSVTVTSLQMDESNRRMLPPRHDFLKKKKRVNQLRMSNPSGVRGNLSEQELRLSPGDADSPLQN
jgi:16S rRNA C967 or C1407 C5-methylase (RsmB/RsmF family)